MEYISTKEAAEIMGVTVRYARKLAKTGVVKARMFGRDWQIERNSAEQFKRERRKLPID